jgi:heme/copper-type cytochrome/quinol oxidase subunit 3
MQMHRFLGSIEAAPPQRDAYTSIVAVLSGGHHAHVLVGLLLNLWLLFRLGGGLTRYRAIGVRAAALYWHFVNVLAVAVTATVLSPTV